MNSRVLSVLLFFTSFLCLGNGEENSLTAERITEAPTIDGILDEQIWDFNSDAVYFYEFKPNNGERSKFKSQVRVVYSDNALYIAARLYDPNPSKIKKELSLRDDDKKNTDLFGFSIDTYKNGQNAFNFIITAAGVQIDNVITNDNFDYNWDAVWKSAVRIDEHGWIVEMEIPFYAIRFPKKDVQEWGLNFYRKVQRLGEESYWSYVDNSVRGLVNQYGVLQGIHHVQPPLRLSFLPYLTSVYNYNGTSAEGDFSVTGGMDLKYGINESFTLDLSLIPDFSQVRSDDQVLNLSPFEVRFSENRPFFTENIDIFSKNGMFYTRRVGQSTGLSFLRNQNEIVESTPGNAPLINALKISGRTKNGTGLGIFNGITERTYAEILLPDESAGYKYDPVTGEKIYNAYKTEERLYDPLTNYNVLVIDQNLKNNSSVGLINTSVIRSDGARDANATGADFTLNDKTNTYRISGRGTISTIIAEDDLGKNDLNTGYSYSLKFTKVSGKWQYGAGRNVESDDYDINDLGFMRAANDHNHFAYGSYNIFRPFGWFNNMRHSVVASYNQLYAPREFKSWNIRYSGNMTFTNFWNLNYRYNTIPSGEDDYFESRNGMLFSKPWAHDYKISASTDRRKPVMTRLSVGRWFRPDWNQVDQWLGMSSRYRLNNKLSVSYQINSYTSKNDIGFVRVNKVIREEEGIAPESIIFGGRDISNTENNIGVDYTFSNKMGLNMRLRHLWSKVDYSNFYKLEDSGEIELLSYNGRSKDNGEELHNINFNAFNVDLNFSWQVAPGSFFTVTWKNASLLQTGNTALNFAENFSKVIEEPHNNSLSFRLTYFIDYVTLRNTI